MFSKRDAGPNFIVRKGREQMLIGIAEKIRVARWSIHRTLVLFSAVVLLALTLLTVTDATGRYFFLQPVKGGTEVSQQMMAYVVFLGLAYTLITGGHVRVTLVLDKLPRKFNLGAQIVIDLVGICFCSLLVYGSWVQFWDSWVAKELMLSAIDIVYWPSKLAMPIGFSLMAIEFVGYLARHLWELTSVSRNSSP